MIHTFSDLRLCGLRSAHYEPVSLPLVGRRTSPFAALQPIPTMCFAQGSYASTTAFWGSSFLAFLGMHKVHGIPFIISTDEPNNETIAAMNEYYAIKAHPEKYKRYSSFKEAMSEVLGDDT